MLKPFRILSIMIVAFFTTLVLGFTFSYFQNEYLRKSIVKDVDAQLIDLSESRYENIPPIVQKYFKYAFNGKDQINARYIYWNEKGDFTLPVGDFTVTAKQISRLDKPYYMWSGLYKFVGFIPFLESRDAFMLSTHNMRAKVGGFLKVMNTDEYSESELNALYSYLLLRYFGTALDFPWVLLPSDNIKWIEKSTSQAVLDIRFNNLRGQYLVTFSDNGAIVQMETEGFMLHGNKLLLREVGKKLNYKELNGLMVPTIMDYSWYMEDGNLDSHYRFEIYNLEYKK